MVGLYQFYNYLCIVLKIIWKHLQCYCYFPRPKQWKGTTILSSMMHKRSVVLMGSLNKRRREDAHRLLFNPKVTYDHQISCRLFLCGISSRFFNSSYLFLSLCIVPPGNEKARVKILGKAVRCPEKYYSINFYFGHIYLRLELLSRDLIHERYTGIGI